MFDFQRERILFLITHPILSVDNTETTLSIMYLTLSNAHQSHLEIEVSMFINKQSNSSSRLNEYSGNPRFNVS